MEQVAAAVLRSAVGQAIRQSVELVPLQSEAVEEAGRSLIREEM
jgi:hypothetical protein